MPDGRVECAYSNGVITFTLNNEARCPDSVVQGSQVISSEGASGAVRIISVIESPPGCIPGDCAARVRPPGDGLRGVIKRVAADADMRFVVDPRVQARVEYTGASIESITYPVLLAILRVHGYVAVEIGGQVSIVPDANARMMPTRILNSDDPSVSDHEVVSRVISLNTDAAALVPKIRPLVPQYGHLAAVGNSLLIVDRYDNVRRITALVNELTE